MRSVTPLDEIKHLCYARGDGFDFEVIDQRFLQEDSLATQAFDKSIFD